MGALIPILLSVLGPMFQGVVKSGLQDINKKLPGWAKPVVNVGLQTGIQFGGAWIATQYGVNPFEGMTELAAWSTLGGVTTVHAFDRWKDLRVGSK